MTVNLPDGILEAATVAWLSLQAWQIQKLFALDKKIAIILNKIKAYEDSNPDPVS